MPSTWTNNLSIEKPATGEQAGVWGTTVNTDFDFFDTGIDGNITIPLSASTYDLKTETGVSEGRNKVVIFTGALTGDGSVNIKPNTAKKIYFVTNHTTGGFALTFSQGTGTGFVLKNGRSAMIYADGGGNAASVFGALADHQVNSLLVLTNLIVQGQLSFSGAQTISVPVTLSGGATISGGVTISPSLTLNMGGDQPYDLLYRSTAGPLARLGIGNLGDALVVGAAGPSWSKIQVGIGSPIVSAVPNRIFFADVAGQLAQDAGLQFQPSVGLGIGRAPATGFGIAVGGGKAMLDGASGSVRELVYTTSSVRRWAWRLNSDAETGGNAGASFLLVASNDAGADLGYPIAFFRDGHTSIGTYADLPATLAVVCNNPGQDALTVRAAAGQVGYLQTWYGTSGLVASIDNAGNFVSVATSGYLKFDANRRVDINGQLAGHPLGTLHIGGDAVPNVPNASIVFESSVGFGGTPSGAMRIYYRGTPGTPRLVIQHAAGYFYLDLTAGNSSWQYTTTPL